MFNDFSGYFMTTFKQSDPEVPQWAHSTQTQPSAILRNAQFAVAAKTAGNFQKPVKGELFRVFMHIFGQKYFTLFNFHQQYNFSAGSPLHAVPQHAVSSMHPIGATICSGHIKSSVRTQLSPATVQQCSAEQINTNNLFSMARTPQLGRAVAITQPLAG